VVGLGPGEHLLVLGNSATGRSGLLRAVAGALQESGVRTWVIDPRRSMSGTDRRPFRTAASADEAAALVRELVSAGRGGARDVLLIDDQELAAGRNGAAVLTPLLDLLPFAADVGLSVVCARRLSGYSRGAFEPFFAGFLEMCDTAVVLSGDPSQGPVIGGIRPRRLPPGRGQLVVRGEPVGEVQLAWRAGDSTDDGAAGWSVIQAAQSGFTPSTRFPVT
jgi:S-DNA-T family DNA segregation ATPase FtsK/SpoIIIE